MDTFLKAYNISIDADKIFHFDYIIRAVFEEGTSYWIELAFKWYDELPYEKKMILKDALSKLLIRKGILQKLFHKARKQLNQLDGVNKT